MRLEDITAEVRPRAPWEAVDLGFHMARASWRPLLRISLALILPLILLIHLLLYDHLIIASVLTWWLKPFYDRIYLYFYSRALFGDTPTVRDTLRALPAMFNSSLFLALTLYRFDPARAFKLPVWQLEGLRGGARRARIRVLQKPVRGTALSLTFACVNLELVLDVGLLFLIVLFIPQHIDFGLPELFRLQQDAGWAQMLANLLYVLAMGIIEPCYIAAGFALYLNRRTVLEGWDIELAFRRLAARLAGGTQPGTARIVASVLVAGLLMLTGPTGLPTPALAADTPPPTDTPSTRPHSPDTGRLISAPEPGKLIPEPDKAQAKKLIDTILARKEFGYWKQVKSLHRIGDQRKQKSDAPQTAPGVLSALIGVLARFGELLLWGLLLTIIILLIVYRKRWLALFHAAPVRARTARPDVLFGMDIRPESLPDDIPAAARALWDQGQREAALSLLYRGALATLVDRDRLTLKPGATEGDCLAQVRHCPGGTLAHYFDRLTQAWQRTAYAHRPPATHETHALLQDWTRHFAPGSPKPDGTTQADAEGAAR